MVVKFRFFHVFCPTSLFGHAASPLASFRSLFLPSLVCLRSFFV